MPQNILVQLRQGGWTVSLTGRAFHSVAVDESHESSINKDCKRYVTHPSAESIDRKAVFMPIRAEAMRVFENQISPEQSSDRKNEAITTIFSEKPSDEKLEINIKSMVSKLETSPSLKLDSTENDHLCHLFSPKIISVEQQCDLLHVRDIGQREFELLIECYILRNPSVKVPNRRKRLLTFTERKSNKRKVSDIEKERKLQIECWKKRIAFSTATGQTIDKMYEQCIELPRALCTSDGEPNKGTKAVTTTMYHKRYEQASPIPFATQFPTEWLPSTVVMEGMFLINIQPWNAHREMSDYANFLIKQHIMPFYRNGAKELHLLFDAPKKNSLKHFERTKRDKANPVSESHSCVEFTEDLLVPGKWRQDVLSCRRCKRGLVCFLAQYLLHKMKYHLQVHQTFITAGGFTGNLVNQAIKVKAVGTPSVVPALESNAEESDTRIWLHALYSTDTNVLVLSPDTDVYHVGLPLIGNSTLKIIVQLNKFNSRELHLLDMSALISAFITDPDLAVIPQSLIPLTIQILFVSTGCDFISYFHGLGKTSFFSTLFDYARFICATDSGMLTDTDEESSFLSFLRLVGSAYFRKHKSVFLPSFPTPITLFNSFSDTSINSLAHHSNWLDKIRERVWSKIKYEEEMVPSISALKRHWKRSRYVVGIWKQATNNIMTYPPLEENGWRLSEDNALMINWDSSEHMSLVRDRVALIRKGCGCRTGCKTNRCKCKKNDVCCGPGCTCDNCSNHSANHHVTRPGQEESEESSEESEEENDLNEQVDEIMYSVFGQEHNSSSADDDMDML